MTFFRHRKLLVWIFCGLVAVAGFVTTIESASGDEKIYADNAAILSGGKAHGGPTTEIPPGMESIYITGVRYVVPKGAKVTKEYGYTQVEPISLYSARRFEDMENRIESLEKKVEQLVEKAEEMEKGKTQEQVVE